MRRMLSGLLLAFAIRPALAQCPDGTLPPCAVRPVVRAPSPTSVAVLYFENLSPDTSDAYLADGLTEEITARLGQVGRLVVASRTAARRLRGTTTLTTSEIGRQLNAVFLVNGSVRRAGQRLRVTVELLRAGGGAQVWTNQFDRATADLLTIQEEIALAVASGVVGRLLPAERVRVGALPTRNPAAYDQYLRGLQELKRRGVTAITQAIAHFEAAERIDRGFARAAAAAARAFVVLEEYLRGRRSELAASSDELLARGLAAADRAIRLDSAVGEAWLARALIVQTLFPRSLDGVREAYEQAVTLEPRSGVVHGDYGVFLRRLGDNDGAERELHQALTLEPQSPGAIANLGVLEIDRRRYQAARQWFDSAATVAPSYSTAYMYRAIVDLLLGHAAAARTNGEVAARLSLGDSADAVSVLAMADVAQGDTITARARLSWLTGAADPDQPHWTLGIYIAPLLVALGDTAQALDLLERIRPRGLQVWYVMRSPRLDALRASARFQRLFAESRPPGAREP